MGTKGKGMVLVMLPLGAPSSSQDPPLAYVPRQLVPTRSSHSVLTDTHISQTHTRTCSPTSEKLAHPPHLLYWRLCGERMALALPST